MVFVLDVGNTNIKCGLFNGDDLISSWRLTTNLEKTSDEYGIAIIAFFEHLKHKTSDVDGIIISSVIPSINYTLVHMCEIYFGRKPMLVSPGIKTGINIKYDNAKELGADRIVNAVAAYEKYGGPVIVVDFGTATTFGAINEKGDFLGGAICPGIKISAEALTLNAARLPRVELSFPTSVIGKSTVTGMQAGLIYGFIGQVEYILRRMKKELGKDAKVVATGGMSYMMESEASHFTEIDRLLTLTGLNIIYNKNIQKSIEA
jgi:type III pantothenate kinase